MPIRNVQANLRSRDLLGSADENERSRLLSQILRQQRLRNQQPLLNGKSLGANLGASALDAISMFMLAKQGKDADKASSENFIDALANRDTGVVGNADIGFDPSAPSGGRQGFAPDRASNLAAILGGGSVSGLPQGVEGEPPGGQPFLGPLVNPQAVGETRQLVNQTQVNATPGQSALGRGREAQLRLLQGQGANSLSPAQAVPSDLISKAPTAQQIAATLNQDPRNRALVPRVLLNERTRQQGLASAAVKRSQDLLDTKSQRLFDANESNLGRVNTRGIATDKEGGMNRRASDKNKSLEGIAGNKATALGAQNIIKNQLETAKFNSTTTKMPNGTRKDTKTLVKQWMGDEDIKGDVEGMMETMMRQSAGLPPADNSKKRQFKKWLEETYGVGGTVQLDRDGRADQKQFKHDQVYDTAKGRLRWHGPSGTFRKP